MISRRALLTGLGYTVTTHTSARAKAQDSSFGASLWQPFIDEASRRFGIPETWVRGVMTAESGGRTHLGGLPIRSRVGAIGLMQLMPATWAEMRDMYALGADPDDPRDNILAGTAYLRAMFDRFGYPGLFAAYNAGPSRYAASLIGQKLPAETQAYLAKVVALAGEVGTQPNVPTPPKPTLHPSDRGLFAIKNSF